MHMTTRRAGRATVALAALAAFFAACSSGGGTTAAPATATAVPASIPPATAAPTTAAAGLLEVRQDATLGAIVTDKDGMTLYLFTNDTGGTSSCTGDCATNWPPLTVASAAEATAGTGVTGAIGTITRADGKLQVTLAGKPLYYFAGDSAAGQTNGQGLFDKWYVVTPAGAKVDTDEAEATQAAATGAPGASKCSGPACY